MPMFSCFHYWRPSPGIKVSLLVIFFAIAVAIWQPHFWLWAVGIVFANHLILTISGLIPRSNLLGPNITQLPNDSAQRGEVAITIDDGPDPEVTPQVLDILDQYQAKATFFCICKLARQHPDLCRDDLHKLFSIAKCVYYGLHK